MNKKLPVIAAIDVGTNSFHLVITSVSKNGILKVHTRDKEMVRLGSGSTDMKVLHPDAIERGVEAMIRFEKLAKSEDAKIVAVATSAVREATNKDIFLKKVKDASGVDIQVISGAEEARLIYIGVIHALPVMNKRTLVIDIGGGSTETVVGESGDIKYLHSAKLGAIRMTKRFKLDTNFSYHNVQECREYIRGDWTPTIQYIRETGFHNVVGTSGTITSLVAMVLASNGKTVPPILNGISVTSTDILKIIEKIISAKSIEQRLAIPGMDPTRADIILGGALILEHIIKALKIDKFLLSDYSLREGIVFDTVQKTQELMQYHHLSRLRYDTVRNAAQHFSVNMEHSELVHEICLQIFDDLQEIHKLGYPERELLEASAYLHDVGYHISHDQHHKHSYYIIKNCIMPGFTNDEAEIIANIARYHRKSLPKKKHENFQILSKEKQQIVTILAGILRIAEGVDRRQMQVVSKIKCFIHERNVDIFLSTKVPSIDIDIEIWGANRRKLLLEKILDLKIDFKVNED